MLCQAIFANENEVPIFSDKGMPAAYIAVNEQMTVYLWDGTPVAYLEPDIGRPGLHVYGFNGKHLGWFVNGVIWDKHGEGACAVKERLQSTQAEPFKRSKQLKPLKAVEFSPLSMCTSSETEIRILFSRLCKPRHHRRSWEHSRLRIGHDHRFKFG